MVVFMVIIPDVVVVFMVIIPDVVVVFMVIIPDVVVVFMVIIPDVVAVDGDLPINSKYWLAFVNVFHLLIKVELTIEINLLYNRSYISPGIIFQESKRN